MKNNKKHVIYLIGGQTRAGKTIISRQIMRRKHLISVSTDVIGAVVKKVLIDESYVSIEKISFKGKVSLRRPGDLKIHKIIFEKNSDENDNLTWDGVLGLIETYDRKNNIDILIEGIAVTPERVSRLKLKNLSIKAVFVGYSNESHADAILKSSKKNKDWIQIWLKEHGGDESLVEDWVKEGIIKSKRVEKLAKKFGYKYFDITKRPFREYVKAVSDYLLK